MACRRPPLAPLTTATRLRPWAGGQVRGGPGGSTASCRRRALQCGYRGRVPEASQQPDPWALRASDADRDKYLELLREAYAEGRLDAAEYEDRMSTALAAKTYRDLYPVLSELPIEPGRVPGPPIANPSPTNPGRSYFPVAPPAAAGKYPAGFAPDDSIVSVFGSANRSGVWHVPTQLQVFSMLGEVTLDLTSAVLPGMDTELRCNAVLGSVTIIVPDALHVDVNGTGVLGEFETKDKRKGQNKRRTPAPNAPTVRITGVALLGSVEVKVVIPKSGTPSVSMRNPPLPPGPQRPQIQGPQPPYPGQGGAQPPAS